MREIEVDYMNINEVFSGLDKLFAENRLPEVERYLTQALSDAEYEKDTDSMLAIYNELIGFHRTTGEHDKALYFCRQVMRLAHKMGIEDTVPYGTALMNIANENRVAGNLLEALSYCRKVYDIYSEQLGPYDILLAGYYNNVALIYQELGDYDKAVDALEHALSIIERHENAGTEIVATYANLGESLLRAGRLKEAQDKLTEAVRRYQLKGVRGYHYSAALSAVAEVWYRQEDYQQALKFYQLAAEELYSVYGDNDTYRVIMNNIETVKAKLQQQ